MTTDLTDRRALVTGAASGIGYAIAAALAEAGAKVYAVDINLAGLTDLTGKTDGAVAPIVCNLSRRDHVEMLPVDDVDILVNCAGLLRPGRLADYDWDLYEHITRVMYLAPARLSALALPGMIERGWGRLVHISSVYGLTGAPGKSPYVAAKHALEGLNKCIALEAAGTGVTSNTVCPTHVDSPLLARQLVDEAAQAGVSPEVWEQVLRAQPADGRWVPPEEVAELVLYLCSPHARSITGVAHRIDGGWLAGTRALRPLRD